MTILGKLLDRTPVRLYCLSITSFIVTPLEYEVKWLIMVKIATILGQEVVAG